MATLKICPFCGRTPNIMLVEQRIKDKDKRVLHYDIDHKCHVDIELAYYSESKDDVIKLWNTRHDLSLPKAQTTPVQTERFA